MNRYDTGMFYIVPYMVSWIAQLAIVRHHVPIRKRDALLATHYQTFKAPFIII